MFVRYGPHHYIHNEWVYNEPDIDRSRIVWARSMPGGKDEELLRYYPKRQAWILDDDERVTLRPFESAPHGKDERSCDITPRSGLGYSMTKRPCLA